MIHQPYLYSQNERRNSGRRHATCVPGVLLYHTRTTDRAEQKEMNKIRDRHFNTREEQESKRKERDQNARKRIGRMKERSKTHIRRNHAWARKKKNPKGNNMLQENIDWTF